MLNKVKLALRINNTAYDGEIQDLINACKRELELAGIASSNIRENDELIIQAIIWYCRFSFGYDNPEAERYQRGYESLKAFLCLSYCDPLPIEEPAPSSEGENTPSSEEETIPSSEEGD